MAGQLTIYRPGKRFPAISVTGERCELRCEHCRGRYLRGMRAIGSGEQLLAAAAGIEASGGTGLLLSGGCDALGRVPLGPFLEAVHQIKSSTRLAVNLHPGLVDGASAPALLASGADVFSVDVLQDGSAIAERLHLGAPPEAYRRTLELLSPGSLAPHVCVGLQSERGERSTIDMLSSFRIRALVVLGLMAPPGSGVRSVEADRLVSFVRSAVRELDAPVLLGCMRPRGRARTEIEIIEAGCAGIVNPAPATVEWARSSGMEMKERQTCCALHR